MSYFIRAFLVDLSCSPRNPPFVAGMLLSGRLFGIGWRVVSCARPTAGIIVALYWPGAGAPQRLRELFSRTPGPGFDSPWCPFCGFKGFDFV